jgi:diacylglycerol kinase family enzyme
MGIPTELEAGCKTLVSNQRRSIDVGRVVGGLYPQGRYFGNGVGIGFDAVVGFEALKLKRLHGFPSYLVAALKTIFLYFNAPQVKLVMDDGEVNLASLMVSVMNGRRAGGGFMMAPDASSDDGLFDLCIAHQVSRPQMFPLISKFMAGTQAEHSAIETARTKKITITAMGDDVLPAHVDGETLCIEGTELAVEILPQQLELVVAREV